MKSELKVFSGNGNPQLAKAICEYLRLPLGNWKLSRFADGELYVQILENVRGTDVFVIQPTCTPVNELMMELLIAVDALKRSSAARITAVMPYYGYARQDRKDKPRVPISAKLVANMIAAAGVERVLTVDLHADQIQGFFDIPLDNVYASPLLMGDIWKHEYPNLIVVSPDVGGVVRARALAKRLDDTELAIIDKRRPRPNESEIMNIIGDVNGKTCVLVDDLVDTAGTLCNAAGALKKKGAQKVVAYCTHAVLSGNAVRNIEASPLDELVVTDTIPLRSEAAVSGRIRQLSVATMLAESVRRINEGESLSSMFVD